MRGQKRGVTDSINIVDTCICIFDEHLVGARAGRNRRIGDNRDRLRPAIGADLDGSLGLRNRGHVCNRFCAMVETGIRANQNWGPVFARVK